VGGAALAAIVPQALRDNNANGTPAERLWNALPRSSAWRSQWVDMRFLEKKSLLKMFLIPRYPSPSASAIKVWIGEREVTLEAEKEALGGRLLPITASASA